MSETQVSKRDVDRLYLQAILSRGIVSEKVAQLLHRKCIEAVTRCSELQLRYDSSKPAWDAFVTSINQALNNLELEFRFCQDENTGKSYYAMVNRKGDEIAQLATDYTALEIQFFKGVIEQIILAPNESYSVSSLAALREISALKLNMTKAQGEILLSSFVAKGWLTKSKRGRYALALRSMLELLPYLKSTYPEELLECTICLELLTRGIACPTRNCKTRLHHHCCIKYRRTKNVCPTCDTEWGEEGQEGALLPVGEEASRDTDDHRRRTRQRTHDSDEEDEAEQSGMDDDEEDEPSQRQTQSKGKGKDKGKKKAVVPESDSDDDVETVDEDGTPLQASEPSRRSARRR